MASESWLDRIDRAFLAGRLTEHALLLRTEGLPASRIVLSVFVVFGHELRRRGRAAELDRLLGMAPGVLEALVGTPLARLERALRERTLGRLVLVLHDGEGWAKGRIVAALMCFSALLDARGQDDEPVLAELDRLTGFAPRERQLWPDEPEDAPQ